MSALEIIVIIACVLVVGGVIALSIINKKKGKTSCGCDCKNCSSCCSCKKEDNEQSDNDK